MPLLATVFPLVLFAFWLLYEQSRRDGTVVKPAVGAFVIGMAITVPVYLLEAALPLSDYHNRVLGVPFLEELFKALGAGVIISSRSRLGRPAEGIVLAGAVALGFATVENAAFLAAEFRGASHPGLVAVVRPFVSVPGHVIFSGLYGYAFGIAKYYGRPAVNFWSVLTLLPAIVLHGLFNALTTVGPVWVLFLLAGAGALWKTLAKIPLNTNDRPEV
jgi:RsiW-degrading membrane proteinase PrsW (M82 family)